MTDDELEAPPEGMDTRDFIRFRALIQKHSGIWLRDGKQIMLASRLARRLRAQGLDSFAEYARLLEQLPENDRELRNFINAVTTNKTSFFRESHHFDFLAHEFVPARVRAAVSSGNRTIRIWSAACSTGEEPYSIAITLLDALRNAEGVWKIEVVASDIDTEVLQKAQEGVYSETALQDMEEARLRRHFLRGKGNMAGAVKIKDAVADRVQFRRINLKADLWPLEGRFDAIFFRNALIYFQRNIQNQFLRKMLQYLNPEGLLFLGHSEQVPWLHDAVTPLKQTIYRRKVVGEAQRLDLR